MKKLYTSHEVSNIVMETVKDEKEKFEKYIKRRVASDMSQYMFDKDVVEFDIKNTMSQYNIGYTIYTGVIRVISAEEEKSLKQCYNALTEFDENPYLRDIKDKIAKILWGE